MYPKFCIHFSQGFSIVVTNTVVQTCLLVRFKRKDNAHIMSRKLNVKSNYEIKL